MEDLQVDLTSRFTRGTFSEREMDTDDRAEFQEVKKKFRGQQGAHSKAIMQNGLKWEEQKALKREH